MHDLRIIVALNSSHPAVPTFDQAAEAALKAAKTASRRRFFAALAASR